MMVVSFHFHSHITRTYKQILQPHTFLLRIRATLGHHVFIIIGVIVIVYYITSSFFFYLPPFFLFSTPPWTYEWIETINIPVFSCTSTHLIFFLYIYNTSKTLVVVCVWRVKKYMDDHWWWWWCCLLNGILNKKKSETKNRKKFLIQFSSIWDMIARTRVWFLLSRRVLIHSFIHSLVNHECHDHIRVLLLFICWVVDNRCNWHTHETAI